MANYKYKEAATVETPEETIKLLRDRLSEMIVSNNAYRDRFLTMKALADRRLRTIRRLTAVVADLDKELRCVGKTHTLADAYKRQRKEAP